MKSLLRHAILLACVGMLTLFGTRSGLAQTDLSPNYDIGVFYFPGWKDNEPGAPAKKPWDTIKKYPEREPLLGWYDEGQPAIVDQQLEWMAAHGIDFVAYDWYWSEAKKPYLEHALRSYLKSPKSNLVRFCLLWANHMKVPENLGQFEAMVDHWISQFFKHPQYYRIDGKPAVFVFSQQNLRDNGGKFGWTTRDLLALAQDKARKAGLPGIYFVGSAEAVDYWVRDYGPSNGYQAFSAYNYHRGFSGTYIPIKPLAHSYEELDAAYRQSWDWILQKSPLPYVVPMTSGWDKRPWGGSKDPWHDKCESRPEEFEAHLVAARERIDRYRDRSKGIGVICCWNEFGEGSYIEPTKRWGTRYLEIVKSVFGAK